MLKAGLKETTRRGLRYIVDERDRPITYQSWAGGLIAPLYDWSMARSVFPRLFEAEQDKHKCILTEALNGVQGQRVLEVGAGSGSAVEYLPRDNSYVGVDVSPALLKRASKAFARAGFGDVTLYVASGDDLPFADECFDLCLCVLTLNFVPDPAACLSEISRVLAPRGRLLCAVPVPERIRSGRVVRGTLYAERDLAQFCEERGLRFEAIPETNGALLYFQACADQEVR